MRRVITFVFNFYFVNQRRLSSAILGIKLDNLGFFNEACICVVYYRASVDDIPMNAFAGGVAAGPAPLPLEKVKVRKNFPETWLWQTLDAG